MDLPMDYQTRMRELLGEDYEEYLKGFGRTVGQTFRVNQLKTEPAELFRRFHAVYRPVAWCETGAYYQGEERLSLHPWYQAGLYYIQEPSAMAPASFLPVSPGEKVLDLCAAPGGKTTALGAKLAGKGLLAANDISISRCRALLKNVQMAGISNAIITCDRPEKLAETFPGYFDKILVDAPCSGEGMFRRDPEMMKNWSVEEVHRYSRLQKEILKAAADMLRPGGMILYSTCTYSPEENEQVVETLLEEKDFELMPLPEYAGVDRGHPEWTRSGDPSFTCCRRFWNHRVEGEGQFAALLRKKEAAGTSDESGKPEESGGSGVSGGSGTSAARNYDCLNRNSACKKTDLPEECTAFLGRLSGPGLPEEIRESIRTQAGRIYRMGERIFLLPEDAPDLTGIRVVSSGLHLGDCKKKRFEPGQALALALRPDQFDQVIRLPSDDERTERYLRCETIPLDAVSEDENRLKDGWCLVCVDDYPLGWGKVQRGRIKNRYPAGWRRQ